jgi:hypothetical protein
MYAPTPQAPLTVTRAGATFALWFFGLIPAHTNRCLTYDRSLVHRSDTRNAFYILQNIKGHFIGVKALRVFFREKVCGECRLGREVCLGLPRGTTGWPYNPPYTSLGRARDTRGLRVSGGAVNLRSFSTTAPAEWTIETPLEKGRRNRR